MNLPEECVTPWKDVENTVLESGAETLGRKGEFKAERIISVRIYVACNL
jgi:hypothetical protein